MGSLWSKFLWLCNNALCGRPKEDQTRYDHMGTCKEGLGWIRVGGHWEADQKKVWRGWRWFPYNDSQRGTSKTRKTKKGPTGGERGSLEA